MGRGSAPAPAIPMSARQYGLFAKELKKRKTSRQDYIRISILLLCSQGQGNKRIAREEGVNFNTVKQWRKRWNQAWPELQIFEQGPCGEGISDNELLRKMLEIISDRPRSGAPARITMAQKQQIVALACEGPEDYGFIMTDWTLEALSKAAIGKKVVGSVSPSYVGRLLKNKPAPTAQIRVLAVSQDQGLGGLCDQGGPCVPADPGGNQGGACGQARIECG